VESVKHQNCVHTAGLELGIVRLPCSFRSNVFPPGPGVGFTPGRKRPNRRVYGLPSSETRFSSDLVPGCCSTTSRHPTGGPALGPVRQMLGIGAIFHGACANVDRVPSRDPRPWQYSDLPPATLPVISTQRAKVLILNRWNSACAKISQETVRDMERGSLCETFAPLLYLGRNPSGPSSGRSASRQVRDRQTTVEDCEPCGAAPSKADSSRRQSWLGTHHSQGRSGISIRCERAAYLGGGNSTGSRK
jgi:hypothetical protein